VINLEACIVLTARSDTDVTEAQDIGGFEDMTIEASEKDR
jgi:hypothetical protein